MASPLKSGKQSVALPAAPVRVSRIRRDPPPVVKEKVVDLKELERRDVTVGVLVFALAITVIILAFASVYGWSPAQYEVNMQIDE